MCCRCACGVQASNRLICVQNHILLAALLNRTLIVPRVSREAMRPKGYVWYTLFSVPHLQACYGRAAVLPTGPEPRRGAPEAPAVGAAPAEGESRDTRRGDGGVPQAHHRRGGRSRRWSQMRAGRLKARAAVHDGRGVVEGAGGAHAVHHGGARRRLGEGFQSRAGPLRVGAVLCWRAKMVGERSPCNMPWKLLRGEFVPPLTSRNVEGLSLQGLLRLHRDELEAVPAIMVLDLFYAGHALYNTGEEEEAGFVDLPIARKRECSGAPALVPPGGIVTCAVGFVTEVLRGRPFLALHLRRKDFLTTCDRGWASACINLRDVSTVLCATFQYLPFHCC